MTGFLVPPSDDFVTGRPREGPLPSLTVLIPVFDERPATLSRLLEQIDPLDYPGDLQVRLVVESTRPTDVATARSVAQSWTGFRIEVSTVRSITPKAKGINEAMLTVETALVALFDADTRIHGAALAGLAAALVSAELDIVEAFDLTTSTALRCRAANAQAIAFQRSMNGLQKCLGRRFMGTSSIVARRSLFDRLGPFPEDGVEEGYRWSMNHPGESVGHGLLPILVEGDVPGSAMLMLNQRTRWITGQLQGSINVLTARAPGHRPLAAAGLLSLAAQGAWVVLLPLALANRRTRWIVAAASAIELARLGSPPARRLAQGLGVGFCPLAGLFLEIGEGVMVWRALARVLLRRTDLWDRVRPGNGTASPKARPRVRCNGRGRARSI